MLRWLGLLLCLITGSVRAEPLVVSAAASLRDVMQELAATFEEQTGQTVGLNFASSGQLMAQIRNGAPADVFISAADTQIDGLQADHLLVDESRTVVAQNELVLIVAADADSSIDSFQNLTDPSLKRLAIGQPVTVPAGDYAMQVLRNLQMEKALADQLIYGANVRTVLSYVVRGEVDAGIVYRTDALEEPDRVRIVATADANWHEPIVYPAAIVRSSPQPELAGQFLTFLNGEKAQAIFQRHGFAPPSGPSTAPVTQPTS